MRSKAMLCILITWLSVAALVVAWADEGKPAAGRDDILFYCSFNDTVTPEIQKGDKGVNATTPVEYTKGMKGKALVTGHAKNAVYPITDNINLTEGTIKLWVMPVDWKAGDNLFHHFFRILDQKLEGQKDARTFDLVLYKFLEWDTVVAYGMSGELTSANLLQIPMEDRWTPKKWHQIGFTWDNQGACLYVDGKGKHQNYLRGAPDALVAESFVVGGPYFVENQTSTAIDELTIYDRKLSDKEMDDLYRTELIEGAMQR